MEVGIYTTINASMRMPKQFILGPFSSCFGDSLADIVRGSVSSSIYDISINHMHDLPKRQFTLTSGQSVYPSPMNNVAFGELSYDLFVFLRFFLSLYSYSFSLFVVLTFYRSFLVDTISREVSISS